MKCLAKLFYLTLLTIGVIPLTQAKIVEYHLDIDYKHVNFTGQVIKAMAIGGTIPAPTLEATVGDTLKVTFHNKMNVETSVHWHGILLPQSQDGVPHLTSAPIAPGESFTYEYPITHHGTYWYHSHTGLQEQRGIYGALVFHPRAGERIKSDQDRVLLFSDWTDENPKEVMHNLKKSDDYYALKKSNVQSWFGAFQAGERAVQQRIEGAWARMGPMDLSDVGYDAFLVNGEREHIVTGVKAGETVRLRLINAAASSYFSLSYAGGPMTVVAADGIDVVPFHVDRLRVAIAETYDVLVTVPREGTYALRATSEDNTGFSRALLGEGDLVMAPAMPAPEMMDHSMHHGEMNHSEMNHGEMNHSEMNHSEMNHSEMNHSEMNQGKADPFIKVEQMQAYELLRAVTPTSFDKNNPIRRIELKLTGDMERYAWSFNNQVLSEQSQILIRRGETVQFVLKNTTMMSHPIHLHGHFFRVLNGQGDFSPLKHTVNVPAMETVTIEFLASEDKDWLFHCHNLYHMKSGMTRVISYQNSSQLDLNKLSNVFSDQQQFYFANLGVKNNSVTGALRAENTRHALEVDYSWDYQGSYEVEGLYERSFNRFFELYSGFEFEREPNETDNKWVVGVHYLLPLLVESDLQLDHKGHLRLGFDSELQLTERLALDWEVNTDKDFHFELSYSFDKVFSIIMGNDDHYGWGVGIGFELR